MHSWDVHRSRDLSLFLVKESGPEYLDCVNVVNIQFSPRQSIHIQAILPKHRELLEIQDGAEFIITHARCGPRDVFENGTPLFRFIDCKVKSRYVQNSISMNENHILFVDVVFECEIEIPEWGQK